MPAKVTIWNRETGEPAVMTTIDARRALKSHPTEWSSVDPNAKGEPKKKVKDVADNEMKDALKDALAALDVQRAEMAQMREQMTAMANELSEAKAAPETEDDPKSDDGGDDQKADAKGTAADDTKKSDDDGTAGKADAKSDDAKGTGGGKASGSKSSG